MGNNDETQTNGNVTKLEYFDEMMTSQYKMLLTQHNDIVETCTLIDEFGTITFRCDCCQKIMKSAKKLLVHRSSHKSMKLFSCEMCPKTFSLGTSLKRHLLKEHLDQNRNNSEGDDANNKTISLKSRKTNTTVLLSKSVIHINDEKQFKCPECSKIFLLPEGLLTHYTLHTGERPFGCKLCDKRFRLRSTLSRHVRKLHMNRKKMRCTFCESIFYSRESLLEHQKENHNSDHVSPEISLKQRKAIARIKNDASVEDCVIINEITNTKCYKCPTCGKIIKKPAYFLEHQTIHTGEKPYSCDMCGKRFRIKRNLKRHVEDSHLKIKKFSCEHCELKFYAKATLLNHVNSHTDNRPFVCETCGNAYRQLPALYKHKITHTDSYPHQCDVCPKKYRSAQLLKVHYRQHTGERPFACEICQATFTDRGILKDHLKVHDNAKKHICDLCGKKYKFQKSLKCHIRSHHQDKTTTLLVTADTKIKNA